MKITLPLLVALMLSSCVTGLSRNGGANLSLGAVDLTGSDVNRTLYDSRYFTGSVSAWGNIAPHVSIGGLIDYLQASESANVLGFRADLDLYTIGFSPMIWFGTDSFDSKRAPPSLTIGVGPRFAAVEEDVEILGISDDDGDFGFGVTAEVIAALPLGERVALTLTGRYAHQDFNDLDVKFGTASALLGLTFGF